MAGRKAGKDPAETAGTAHQVDETAKTLAEARADAVEATGADTAVTRAEVAAKGYFGTSPAREASGKSGKGLSQPDLGIGG